MHALFCGDGTLLIRCAEIFVQGGGTVRAVLTRDERVTAWADQAGLRVFRTADDPALRDMSFDWLFSVANLAVLPADLIGQARRGAINFHDGPLPRYAGLNVPAWAILAGETAHAVSWHEMTAAVDAGSVLAAREVEIGPTDTSFSLNAKCYEAGLESFGALVADLASDTLKPRTQHGQRGWYGKARRPRALGLLDPQGHAADISALVRALDFGGYDNPLGLAKLWTGDSVYVVHGVELLDAGSETPGTVLSVGAGEIVMAASDALVRLTGLTDMAGHPATPTVGAGTVLPRPPVLGDEAAVVAGRDDGSWTAVLQAVVPVWPPFPAGQSGDGTHEATLDLPEMGGDELVAGFASWAGALGGAPRVTLALWQPADHPGRSPLRPLGIECEPGAAVREVVARAAAGLASARGALPMPVDLPLRLADPEQRSAALQAMRIIVADAAEPALLGEPGRLILVTDRPRLVATGGVFAPRVLEVMAASLSSFLRAMHAAPDAALAAIGLGAPPDLAGPPLVYDRAASIHSLFLAQAARQPGSIALESGDERLSYGDLDMRTARLAGALVARGAGPGRVVGVCLDRSADLVVALLAVLRTGAAYLPLDPAYPAERIAHMLADSGAALIVADKMTAAKHGLDPARLVDPRDGDLSSAGGLKGEAGGDSLAYLIYTSGSTGRPKGVMVPHRAVMNFFAGMDALIPIGPEARLLSVTSVSFDISVLEIFWTLARGATLVLQAEAARGDLPGFSLFYFASEASGSGHHAYRLLIEGSKFADANGFEAIWTPERHFHAFGGLYPNPAISSAMVAGITRNVKLRAGSSVVPLHHPIRVAEDWALVDNLSNGRAGIALASGWQPNDFVVRPYAFEDRKQRMLETIDVLRRLWRGEAVPFPNHKGEMVPTEIHPKPMQAELPLWITAAGNPETFVAAGEKGCGVLTHLLGQTFEEVAEKIAAYRAAWAGAGHAGQGHVTLMLHTFIGEDEDVVRETVRQPMKGYLKSAVDLVKRASWTFPTIVERASAAGMSPQEMFEKEELSAADLDALLDHAFDRYYRTSGLFGTPDSAKDIIRRVADIGVDEVACLIDFGVDTDVALANLPNIRRLMDALAAEGGVGRRATVAEDIVAHGITHLQCTPSLASLLATDAAGRAALGQLQVMMVGGEALPPDLARDLVDAVGGRVFNMYGPTETTIWSAVAELRAPVDSVRLGAPIANTVLSVRAPGGAVLPSLAAGELWIGGAGVADGYWQRPDLTAERFVDGPSGRFYRSGDLVRRHSDGSLEFLGRLDNQVKIRGHRIELGEIEAALAAQPGVRQAVVSAVAFGPGDTRLVGYATPLQGARPEAEALRRALAARLPDVMVPAQILVIEAMPMTPNGKIDRKALPHPAVAAETPVEAEGDLETTIAAIWSEALGLPAVDVTRNFFDLGGHSLLVVQVQRRMKERLGRDIAITDVFRFPTVRGLAAHLGAAEGGDAPDAASRGAARAAARLARRGARTG